MLALVRVDLVVSLQDLQDVVVHLNRINSYDSASLFVRLHLVVPRMISDVLYGESLDRIRVENEGDQVFGFLTEERGQFVVSTEDLLVKLLGVLVLKRQVAADHCVENDA